jgi:DNA-binding NtrC family response regulator
VKGTRVSETATASRSRILVVEDDQSMQGFLTDLLEDEGYEVRWATHGGIALEALAEQPYDLVLTDIIMPEVDGEELLDRVQAEYADTPVVIMTGQSSVRQAVDLMRRGAADYFKKPFDVEEMLHVLGRCIASRAARDEIRAQAPAEEAPTPDLICPQIIGRSAAMRPVYEMIAKVADTHSTVLIQGQSGTGKELVARAVHENSSRRSQAFIPVHCGAIPETLLESELFGHEKGSFTGAVARKEGVFKLADQGTLFLDEVSEMSVPLQVKLLRVLETSSFRRVGGVEDIYADVRVVAATNRELRELVDKNLFRQDLYFRLNVFPIQLPPLRERAGDVPLLIEHLLEKLRRSGTAVSTISEPAMHVLAGHSWPGNVRELENAIERAAILCGGGDIHPEHLPPEIRPGEEPASQAPSTDMTFQEAKRAFEKQWLEKLLAQHDGSVSAAAKAADMSRAHLYELIKKLDIDR